MINIIPITIDERGSVKKDIQILAMEGENLSKTFSILLPNSIKDKWLYIEFEKADGTKFVSEKLQANGSYLIYDVTNQLTIVGKLICQVIAKDGNNVVWKSSKFDFTIPSSINATEEVAASNPDILADLQKQIDNIEVGGGADLTNYYSKDETYSKAEVDTQINNVKAEIPAGGASSVPIVEVNGSNITLEPNKHYVISGVSNSLTISLKEAISTELKHYSFEFSSIDRIPKVTVNGVDMPLAYEFAKYTKYLCEIVNNKFVIVGSYDGYPYKFVYGLYSSSDYTTSYNLKEDKTFAEVISGTTRNGTYKVEQSGEMYLITLTFEDSSVMMFNYDNNTITNSGVVYTKLS